MVDFVQTTGPFIEAINAIQDINSHLLGIESSPHLAEYPAHIDTMQMPLSITHCIPPSGWPANCEQRAKLRFQTVVYVDTFNQDYFGDVMLKVYAISGNHRKHYLDDANTWLYPDQQRMIIDRDELQVWLDQSVDFQYSGYIVREYPVQSGNFHHTFDVQFGVIVHDLGCSEDV